MTLQYTGNAYHQWPGIMQLQAVSPNLGTGGRTTVDASGEYESWAFYAHEDMVISHVGLKLQAATGSPTADIRLETLDVATGLPTGTLIATNTNIITGTLTTSWTVHALTAAASVTRGTWAVLKILYNSGTSFQTCEPTSVNGIYSGAYRITNTGTPTRSSLVVAACIGLGSSATVMYPLYKNSLFPIIAGSGGNINNTNGARFGIRFQVPFKCEINGFLVHGVSQDMDYAIYDDAGSAISGASGSYDASASNNANHVELTLGTPFAPTINTWYRAAIIPTTASNSFVRWWQCQDTDMLTGMPGQGLARRTDYTTAGGWSDANAAYLPLFDLVIKRLDDGASVGGRQKVYGG